MKEDSGIIGFSYHSIFDLYMYRVEENSCVQTLVGSEGDGDGEETSLSIRREFIILNIAKISGKKLLTFFFVKQYPLLC